ncbi:polysaccharide deacetylase family protein [Streptosporangium roseum]|uniref:polysaccharide deacetylase family protein n=1 Tax=Streptosporangium roseum TaxID=2001 RepID=UPI0033348A18
MTHPLYPYSPMVSRPKLEFPDGKRLAFYIGLNIEHFRTDVPLDRANGPLPDPLSFGWRDYGNRAGIWRMIDVFDKVGIRASAIVNSDVCTRYPEIIQAGVERDWAWVAHGQTNSTFMTGMTPEEEEQHLKEMFATLDATLPARPKGWLGPGLTETYDTPGLLAEAGLTYLLDWCADDQPFPLNVPGLISVPYSVDVNDFLMYVTNPGLTGPDFERVVFDQFEVLLEESATTGKVMALPLHTFIMGQPHRSKYLARLLKTITSTPEVWVCTSDDIAEHYLAGYAGSSEPA